MSRLVCVLSITVLVEPECGTTDIPYYSTPPALMSASVGEPEDMFEEVSRQKRLSGG